MMPARNRQVRRRVLAGSGSEDGAMMLSFDHAIQNINYDFHDNIFTALSLMSWFVAIEIHCHNKLSPAV